MKLGAGVNRLREQTKTTPNKRFPSLQKKSLGQALLGQYVDQNVPLGKACKCKNK